jgi:hypothetical protein
LSREARVGVEALSGRHCWPQGQPHTPPYAQSGRCERVSLLVLPHPATTYTYLQGIDAEEILTALRTRRAPTMSEAQDSGSERPIDVSAPALPLHPNGSRRLRRCSRHSRRSALAGARGRRPQQAQAAARLRPPLRGSTHASGPAPRTFIARSRASRAGRQVGAYGGGVREATRSPAPDARAAPTSRARRGPSCARPDRGG